MYLTSIVSFKLELSLDVQLLGEGTKRLPIYTLSDEVFCCRDADIGDCIGSSVCAE